MNTPMLDPKLVGEVIAEFRRKKGISQEVLSGLADIGRTHLSAIDRYSNGRQHDRADCRNRTANPYAIEKAANL